MEGEESCFIFENKSNLKSQYQRIQYDSANKWKTKVWEAEQPQHRKAIERVGLIWLTFLKLEP